MIVTTDQKPPHHASRESVLEISLCRMQPHVTSLNMRMVTVEVTHVGEHFIILGDVVVDPHPPAWIQLGDIDCQCLQ